ncbi:MAG: hypothetical protein NT096_09490 [Proteobacteria bacterium]|nr:hypothetical protein [Pseudomonadota bacterium]
MKLKYRNQRYLFLFILIFCSLISSSSPSLAATVSGTVTVTCDTYTTGGIIIVLLSKNGSITSVTLDAPGPYTLTVDDSHLGETVYLYGLWDKDGSNGYSVGDCIGWGSSFQLAAESTADLGINHKITATVSGNVICDAHTNGYIYPFVLVPSGQVAIITPHSEPGPYTCFVYDVPIGSPVNVFGTWDADGSGVYPYTYGDYLGWYTGSSGTTILPITLEEENTGIDVNISHKYVADISGTVTCSQSTSGSGYISLYDGPDPNTANNIVKFGPPPPLSFPSSYQYMIFDISLGTSVWVFGYWDKDSSASLTPGDYIGSYSSNPITLQQTNTNINFDACQGVDSNGDWIVDCCWQKSEENPLTGIVGVPSVMKDGDVYKMWYGTYDGGCYAESSDGIHWTPLGCQTLGVKEEPYHFAVIKNEDGSYELWIDNGWYSTSLDGQTWIDFTPISIASAGNPTVLKEGSLYKMWHRLSQPNENMIGYSTSSDGITWATNPNPVLTVGESGTWDDNDAVEPCVIKDGTLYKMWYRGENKLTGVSAIGLATSTDGINWAKFSNNPILSPDAGTWEGNAIQNPFVIKDGVYYKMWYTDKDAKTGIGYAFSPECSTWSDVISKYQAYVSGQATWNDVITCYQQYAS